MIENFGSGCLSIGDIFNQNIPNSQNLLETVKASIVFTLSVALKLMLWNLLSVLQDCSGLMRLVPQTRFAVKNLQPNKFEPRAPVMQLILESVQSL